MIRRNLGLRALLVLALLCAGMLFAQNLPIGNINTQRNPNMPVGNINAQRNPNLGQAQKLCSEAYQWIVKAQKANKYDMQGHAAKAKHLLIQASQELVMADKIADSATPRKTKGLGTTRQNPVSGVTSKLPQ